MTGVHLYLSKCIFQKLGFRDVIYFPSVISDQVTQGVTPTCRTAPEELWGCQWLLLFSVIGLEHSFFAFGFWDHLSPDLLGEMVDDDDKVSPLPGFWWEWAIDVHVTSCEGPWVRVIHGHQSGGQQVLEVGLVLAIVEKLYYVLNITLHIQLIESFLELYMQGLAFEMVDICLRSPHRSFG